jgi:NDP-sugar pyrophosphorylase family protein
VGLAAIVVMEAETADSYPAALPDTKTKQEAGVGEPLACVEIMGRSMLERTIERFVRANVDVVRVLMSDAGAYTVQPTRSAFDSVKFKSVSDVGSAIGQEIREFSRSGIEHTFVISANVYAETDLFDLFCFHRESRQKATKAVDRDGPLGLGIVDCAKAQEMDIESFLTRGEGAGSSYFIREYVSRLTHPRDLRRVVTDALSGRCTLRPAGTEVKPGIWVDEGAQIHRRARLVAPAYIGRGSKVRQDTVITRCSSVEKDCYVDCGTVIEDSSILSDTRIGISVDVCHAVVNGNKLLNLERDVVIEISDPGVMRSTSSIRKQPRSTVHPEEEQQVVVADLQEEKLSTPEPWQLGTNPIQG